MEDIRNESLEPSGSPQTPQGGAPVPPPDPATPDAPALSSFTLDEPTLIGSTRSSQPVQWDGPLAPPPPTPAGIAGLGGYVAPPASPRRRRGPLLAVGAAVCLVALLAGGSFWIFNALAAPTEIESARALPAETVAFASVDLVAAAKNTHHVDPKNLQQITGQSDASFKQATGLDWQSDVVPWLGRDVTVATFARPAPATAQGTVSSAASQLGEAMLIQARDDTAAQGAVKKAADYQKQKGQTVTTTTYGGFTVYSVGTSALAEGKGWAVLASDSSAADVVIDRMNGKGDTLDKSGDFQSAIKNLSSTRIGTLFVNVRQLVKDVSPTNSSVVDVPLVNTYPTMAGAINWTDAGLRAQMTTQAQRSEDIANLAGDTTGLASFVPQGATSYVGAANAGALYQAALKLTVASLPTDPAQQALGISATNPIFQHPAAVVALNAKNGEAKSASGELLLLRAPDQTAVQSALLQAAQKNNWTLKSAQIGGQDATAIYSQQSGASTPVAVTTFYKGVFMAASNEATLTQALDTAKGSSPSLAQSATFKALTAKAPTGAAVTTYLNSSALNGGRTDTNGQFLSRATGVLGTTVWTDASLQTTTDVQLNG